MAEAHSSAHRPRQVQEDSNPTAAGANEPAEEYHGRAEGDEPGATHVEESVGSDQQPQDRNEANDPIVVSAQDATGTTSGGDGVETTTTMRSTASAASAMRPPPAQRSASVPSLPALLVPRNRIVQRSQTVTVPTSEDDILKVVEERIRNHALLLAGEDAQVETGAVDGDGTGDGAAASATVEAERADARLSQTSTHSLPGAFRAAPGAASRRPTHLDYTNIINNNASQTSATLRQNLQPVDYSHREGNSSSSISSESSSDEDEFCFPNTDTEHGRDSTTARDVTDSPEPQGRNDREGYLVEATLVRSEHLGSEMFRSGPFMSRERYIPKAEIIEETNSNRGKWLCLAIFVAIMVATVGTGIACGVGVGICETRSNKNSGEDLPPLSSQKNATAELSTLKRVQQRGYVICGAYQPDDYDVRLPPPANIDGFQVAFCQAIAAVVLNDATKVKYKSVLYANIFQVLVDQTVDALTMPVTYNMQQDVHDSTTRAGLSFSTPFFYSGMRFAGLQEYIACLDNLDVSIGICRDVKICVARGTTHSVILEATLPAAQTLLVETQDDCFLSFAEGKVNSVAGTMVISLTYEQFQAAGYNGPIYYSKSTLSREPNSIATLDSDTEWADIIRFVVDAVYTAEGLNLTKEGALSYLNNPSPSTLWEGVDSMLTHQIMTVVATIGNYAELYYHTLQAAFPRGGLNSLNENNTTGLLYSFPFGKSSTSFDPTIEPGPKISLLKQKGMIRCGVYERPGLAMIGLYNQTWSGLDIELCRSVAAALFRTEVGTLEIVSLEAGEGFTALEDDVVDVVAGQQLTLANKYRVGTTGLSFDFSPSYFYSEASGEMYALVSSRSDPKFSDFVHWTVIGLIYAEENHITSSNATKMPVVNLFGDDNRQMFIDCVGRLGNFGEIYERTLGSFVPRMGRNLLNSREAGYGPQQFSIPVA